MIWLIKIKLYYNIFIFWYNFIEKKSISARKQEVLNIRSKFPAKIPVIVERYKKEKDLPRLDKVKFLVPQELSGRVSENKKIYTKKLVVIRVIKYNSSLTGNSLWFRTQLVSQFVVVVRSRLVVRPSQSLHFIVGNKSG